MTDLTAFNRTYTAYTRQGTTVFLANGGLSSTASGYNPTIDIIAGENMDKGSPVYVSGTRCFAATASSSSQLFESNVIGFTEETASLGAPVTVDLDGVVNIPGDRVTGEAGLTPGRYYFLSRYKGELTTNSSASGTVERPDYQVSVPVGVAVTTTALTIEIGSPTFLV